MSGGRKNGTDTAKRRGKAKDQTAAEEWQVSADMLRRTVPLAPWLAGDTSGLPKAPPGKRAGR